MFRAYGDFLIDDHQLLDSKTFFIKLIYVCLVAGIVLVQAIKKPRFLEAFLIQLY
jgi:hypothetical protein